MCVQTHSSNVIVKFADDTTVIGLITDNDETAYREEVSTLTKWCQVNHLSLNIDKTKELVVDFRRQSREHTPITIDKTPEERVSSFKFLCVHITEDLTWSAHTDAVLKKAHQRLFFLRWLRKFGLSPSILRSFYTCLRKTSPQHTPTLQYAMHCTLTWTQTQFNWTTHTHTAQIQQPICYHWIPSKTPICTSMTLRIRPM